MEVDSTWNHPLVLNKYCRMSIVGGGNYLSDLFRINHECTTTWLNYTWWRHQMETFSALLVICAQNEFPAQRPVTRSFDVFFDLHLNKRLSKQSWGWWFDTLSCPSWRHCNENGPCAWLFDAIQWILFFALELVTLPSQHTLSGLQMFSAT